jgi:hypothetical protein
MRDKRTCDAETDVKKWKEINKKLFKRNCAKIPYISYKNENHVLEYYTIIRTITDPTNNRIFKPPNISVPIFETIFVKTIKCGCINSRNKIPQLMSE